MRCFHKDRISLFHLFSQMHQKFFQCIEGYGFQLFFRLYAAFLCRFGNFFCQGSHTDQKINATISRKSYDLPVQLFFILSQFSHVSQNGHFSSHRIFQDTKRSLHGHRVCVVTVIHDRVLFVLNDMEPTT